jgi:DNA-binding response OmpR family regulator
MTLTIPATQKCPCCGQAVDNTGIMLDLTTGELSTPYGSTRLSDTQRAILHATLKARPNIAPYDRIYHAIWGHSSDMPDGYHNALRVHIMRMRRVIRPLGLELKCYYKNGLRLTLKEPTNVDR